MPLALNEVRRIAQHVATARDPSFRVLSASTTEGGSAYTELLIAVDGCSAEPCRLLIGVERTAPEAVFRAAIDEQLCHHIERRNDHA